MSDNTSSRTNSQTPKQHKQLTNGETPLITTLFSIESMVNQFLSNKKVRTRQNYGTAMLRWGGFLQEHAKGSAALTWDHLLKAGPSQVKAFLHWLTERGIASNTQAVYLAGLAGFYDELIHTGFPLPGGNPFKNPLVKLPRGARDPASPSRSFTEDQVEAILDTAETDRDRAILALLFGAGLRKGELLSLETDDISRKGGVTILTLRNTKTKKVEEYPLGEWVADALNGYARRRKGKVFDLSHAGLDKLFSRLVAKAGIEGKWSPHDARCTGINLLVGKGESMARIQKFSRHQSMRMVEEYIRKNDNLENNPSLDISYGRYGKKGR